MKRWLSVAVAAAAACKKLIFDIGGKVGVALLPSVILACLEIWSSPAGMSLFWMK